MERNLDFDLLIDRKNTNSVRYDFKKKYGKSENLLPFWIADMDFRVSSYIQDAMSEQIQHGIFGYCETTEEYFDIVKRWFLKHHAWEVKREWLVKAPCIVYAIAVALLAFTEPGDAILVQEPVYNPFFELIQNNGRRVVNNPLKQGTDGRYYMDIEDFQKKVKQERVKLFLLCNPHNPVGRVWSREELEKIGDICYREHVLVLSDEIHADFVFQGKHQVFADLKEEYREITITCTSPGKTFNIAGLHISNVFIANPVLKQRFEEKIAATGMDMPNAVGVVACKAAYKDGEEWYQHMISYIKGNIAFVYDYLKNKIPKVHMQKPEGTYLVWLDFRDLHLTENVLQQVIEDKAGLWLDCGQMFGSAGKGFQRMNIACPRSVLKQALEQLQSAVERL